MTVAVTKPATTPSPRLALSPPRAGEVEGCEERRQLEELEDGFGKPVVLQVFEEPSVVQGDEFVSSPTARRRIDRSVARECIARRHQLVQTRPVNLRHHSSLLSSANGLAVPDTILDDIANRHASRTKSASIAPLSGSYV